MNNKFIDPVELENRIQEYFNNRDNNDKPYTISSLAVWLDTNRMTLLNYSKEYSNSGNYYLDTNNDNDRDLVCKIIAKAKATIEAEYEDMLFNRNTFNGSKFTLVNNCNWKDKQEIESNNVSSIDLSGVSLEDLKKIVESDQ